MAIAPALATAAARLAARAAGPALGPPTAATALLQQVLAPFEASHKALLQAWVANASHTDDAPGVRRQAQVKAWRRRRPRRRRV